MCLLAHIERVRLSVDSYLTEGLYESLLYHLVRSDNRHNFSAYFYALYLRHGSALRFASFGPMLLIPLGAWS